MARSIGEAAAHGAKSAERMPDLLNDRETGRYAGLSSAAVRRFARAWDAAYGVSLTESESADLAGHLLDFLGRCAVALASKPPPDASNA